jgi:Methyltransferase FkbM domain
MLSVMKALRDLCLAGGFWVERGVPDVHVKELVRAMRPLKNRRGLKRFGPEADGGYLMPDDLHSVVGCLSPGVSNEIGFDWEMAELGIPVYMTDASVSGPPRVHPQFHFRQKFVGVRQSSDYITLDELAEMANRDGDLILQMDIEGAEYEAIADATDSLLQRIRIAALELHDVHRIFSKSGYERMVSFLAKMRRYHELVHVHPNNTGGAVTKRDITVPCTLELTYYRRDRDSFVDFDRVPARHPFDVDNASHLPSLNLPDSFR